MWLIISFIIQVELMKDVIDTVWFKDAFKITYLTKIVALGLTLKLRTKFSLQGGLKRMVPL